MCLQRALKQSEIDFMQLLTLSSGVRILTPNLLTAASYVSLAEGFHCSNITHISSLRLTFCHSCITCVIWPGALRSRKMPLAS